jgi:quinone-modifying oxidoreductase subunit QmoB
LPVGAPYDASDSPGGGGQDRRSGSHAQHHRKTETEVARIAGQPGEFTVTLKKPGEKIPFDVPFPLPEEMKVDESGKELDVEKQHEAYLEYNEGKKTSCSWTRTANCSVP